MMTNRAPQRAGMKLGSALVLFLLGAAGAAYAAPAQTPDCTTCHDQGPKVAKSAHASLTCDTCHENYNPATHPAGITKPACATCHTEEGAKFAGGVHGMARKAGNEGAPDCGVCHGSAHEVKAANSQAFRASVPETCGMCHTDVAEQYNASVHGKALARGIVQAPTCADCHGEHDIIKPSNAASPVNGAHIRETCGSCHGDVRLTRKFGLPADRIVSFDSSFHGLAAKAGSQTVANCASCHGVHNILPSSDPKSTISPGNLPATCGKCHPGAGTRFAISRVHVVAGAASEPAPLRWVRSFYLLLIPVTLGLMLLHNAGDWIRKLIRLRFRLSSRWETRSLGRPVIRMLPFERVQHAVLAISFLLLVWTGFALKYPEQWWARPLLIMEGKVSWRSLLHRVAAGVFMAVSVAHLVSLIVNRKLRNHWKEMLPKVRDAREAAAGLAYNIGLGSEKPARSSHSYIEKAEYWAVVWGAVIMVATGLLLWANNLALKFFPKLWLDLATSVHFYEAVLAFLAIVIWHFYSAILDPDVYPLNTAFLTGFSVKKHEEERKPDPEEAEIAGD
jgi:cytochrome b subunit of formate dehydrogenase